nr:EOG090X06BA [Sida crystallina]
MATDSDNIKEENHFESLVAKIVANDAVGLQELMKTHNIKTNSEDGSGMTLLQHASFKGKLEMCQLLIDLGSDPNGGHHEHKYSALHFAALSGNADVCQLVLQHGCKMDSLNSVGRTAAQMAAFVGNHHCVSIINNFIPREDIDHFTRIAGSRKEPLLPPASAPAVHRLVMQVNLHPVRVVLTIQKLPLIWENLSKVKEVLGQLSEGQMKRGKEANEILSLKYHYLHFLVAMLDKEKQKKNEASLSEMTVHYAKLLLKQRSSDGFPEYMDNFVRESVKTFPFKDTTVFRQLLTNLSKTKQDPQSPLAISLLNSCINGQRGFQEDDPCPTCGQEKAAMKCSQCKAVRYCDRECQKLHWPLHKKECHVLAKDFQSLQIQSTEQVNESKADDQHLSN